MKYYKWLKDGRVSTHTDFTWPEIGKWLEVKGRLEPCSNGLHVMLTQHLWEWCGEGYTLYEVEVDGEKTDNGDKIVCRKARLTKCLGTPNDRALRLLACDIAETVLPIFEKKYPDDKRPRKAIEVARLYVDGKATNKERAAARAAAWAAARAAARDAARDAAWAAVRAAAWAAAWAAVRDAAWAAAWAAARDAAGDAAGDAAKKRYGKMLLKALEAKP